MDRQDVFAWCKERYGTEPDYPWGDENAVLRHKGSGKWYGAVLSVKRGRLNLSGEGSADVLNVKSEPALIGALRTKEGFFPAYHMNKENWISILLEGERDNGEIWRLIELSYQMTRKK